MEMFIYHHEGRYMKYNARKTDIKTDIYIYIYRKKAQLKVCTPNVMCMFTLTTDACLLRKEPGSCFNQDLRFYWDGEVAECRPLMYSGCGGNGNNFATQDDCYAACGRAVTGTPSRRKNYAFDCFLG